MSAAPPNELAAAPIAGPARASELWERVDNLVDRAPSLADLQRHRLDLFAARRWRSLGRPVPTELQHEERAAAVAAMIGPRLLQKVRASYDGPIVVFKGIEAATFYPERMRPFSDIDLLVEDSKAAQKALLANGFVEVGDPELFIDIHHERPLCVPGVPVAIEVHHTVKWPDRLEAPRTEELLADALPSATGVEGILAPPPAQHAVLLAAHAWAHLRLRRLIDLIDVAALTMLTGRAEPRAVASRWGVGRLWRVAEAATDSVLFDGRTTWAQRLWAQNLSAVRDRTVFEAHVDRWLAPFWALPFGKAVQNLGSTAVWEFTPADDEDWSDKRARIWRAMKNRSLARSEHERQLGLEAHKRRRR
jgi:hypothetical protein